MTFGTPMALVALVSLIPLTAYVSWSKRPQMAVLLVAFFAALFGPEGAFFKLPLVPPLDKLTLPYLLLFIVAVFRARSRMRRAKPMRGIDLLIAMAFIAGFVTFATNGDSLTYGSWKTVTLPALAINDGLQLGFQELLLAGLPFVLGRVLFRGPRDLRDLLHFLVVAGLIQTAFIWVELRLSPQFHNWIYGYSAHSDFLQTIRWGGYRPMVFTAHGLALSIFMLVTFLACLVLKKAGEAKIRDRFRIGRVAIYLGVVLLLCKSTGAILYALLLAPLVLRSTPERQMKVATVLGVLVLLYPALRASDLVPTEWLVEQATAISPERAQSLEFRFDNEEMLLEKARERIAFGWGGHSRRSVYDDELGKEIAVSDGHWIIVLGRRGIIGFIEAFGLLVFPIFFARRRFRRLTDDAEKRALAGFALIVAICSFDLLPNGLFSNYVYLLAGALMGMAQQITKGRDWGTR